MKNNKKLSAKIPYAFVLFGMLILAYSFFIEPILVISNVVQITSDDLATVLHDKKVVQISDLHITSIGLRETKLIKTLNRISPDILFITGDLLTHGKDEDACIALLQQIKHPPLGIWIVLGNTDRYTKDGPYENIDRFIKRIKRLGIKVLEDSCERLVINEKGEHVFIAGVEEPPLSRSKLDLVLKDVNSNSPVILISHYPDVFEKHPDALIINLGDPDSKKMDGWGWQDNAFFEHFNGIVRFETNGMHSLRVQRREAGVLVHQICLVSQKDNKAVSDKNGEKITNSYSEFYSAINPDFHEMVILKAENISDSRISGSWQKVRDASAGNDIVMKDVADVNIQHETPFLEPENYFEVSFFAEANIDYHLWARMRKADEAVSGDSIYIQFDDSINKDSEPVFRIGELGNRKNLSKVDLILAGHTHGGQIRFPIIGAMNIVTGHSLKYDMGLFEENGTKMYVNRGIGTTFLPIRFLCSPEITVFSFEQSKNRRLLTQIDVY